MEIRLLIQRMARENPIWGAPRIQSELALLGYTVAESTVAKYMKRQRTPPSQRWRTFLGNHVPDIVAVDFFVVATVSFRLLYCFLVLRHDRRRVVHFNVTAHPTARWTAQQVVEAFPYDEASRFLIRDHDDIYGQDFRDRIKHIGIEEVVISYRSIVMHQSRVKSSHRPMERLALSPRSAVCTTDTPGPPETADHSGTHGCENHQASEDDLSGVCARNGVRAFRTPAETKTE